MLIPLCEFLIVMVPAITDSYDTTTVSAQLEAHSWIEPHPLEKLIQAQSKTDIETIQAQLEYSPSQKIN